MNNTDKIKMGGLMRCCLTSVDHLYPDGPAQLATEGQVLQCEYTDSPDHRMIFHDGTWSWHPENPL